MALPPQSDEAFLREVDEELRRDQMTNFWRRYGRLMLILVALGLALFGGYLWWEAESEKAAGLAGEKMNGAIEALGHGNAAAAEKTLGELSVDKSDGYRAAARMTLAVRKLEQGNAAAAAADFDAVAADTSLPQPFRDAALLRSVAATFDQTPPAKTIERLKPLAVPDGAWFGSATEMTAVSWLKLNRPDKAGPLFAALAKDSKVPATIRARAVRIAGALGIDAVPAVAAPGKE